MAGKSQLDNFDQWFAIAIANTAVNAEELITKLETGIGSTQKILWMVSRIEYEFGLSVLRELHSEDSYVQLALTQGSLATQLVNLSSAAVIDYARLMQNTTPAALSTESPIQLPIIHQYPPGKEILMLPSAVYLHYKSYALTAAAAISTHRVRVWYKELEVGPEDYYDLLQLRLPLGAT